ncbi:single-stranded DNA-binding protein [PVC group bacterium (ex Bugula neritina AB1)]|nr:single-stranded DNA-binding protein [PVC group bacterium (ex Bugula neritina AB1)]
MAATLNKVLLLGNLTRDPELRYIPSGSAVANLGIAVNRSYTTQSGEKKEEVCYVRVVAWSKLAEICGEYLTKGSPILVEGRLQSRSWETEDGQKRTSLEIVADNIQFVGRKDASSVGAREDSSAKGNASSQIEEGAPQEEEVPF